jgi:hypothetical protein
MAWSADGHDVKTFGVTKHVVTMEDPLPWWEQRVKHARAAPAAPEVGFPGFFGLDGREFDEKFDESFPTGGFWTLIHPSIREEVSRRFAIHEYADAVMAALQVVAHTVREKTGIREDGARLMANAFGGDRPYLVFDDPMPQTQQAMQSTSGAGQNQIWCVTRPIASERPELADALLQRIGADGKALADAAFAVISMFCPSPEVEPCPRAGYICCADIQ